MNELVIHADYAVTGSPSVVACDVDAFNRWLRSDLHNLDGPY